MDTQKYLPYLLSAVAVIGAIVQAYGKYKEVAAHGDKHELFVAVVDGLRNIAKTADPVHSAMVEDMIFSTAKKLGLDKALDDVLKDVPVKP